MLPARPSAVRGGLVALTVLALLAGLNAVGGAAATPRRDGEGPPVASTEAGTPRAEVHAPVPTLHWRECDLPSGPSQCANVKVPRDYDHPYGAKTTLAVSRVQALDPTRRIGTLFVNPGGPGLPASNYPWPFVSDLGPHIVQRFDVVGVDPRGVGDSAPLLCRDPSPDTPHPGRHVSFPYTPEEITAWLHFDAYVSHLCATHSRPILDHMSTADTARDMDLIRQALGEPRINYYGLSYGTYLGATYAALFPGRIRAMVLDGVLDPVAWATGRNGRGHRVPFTSRLRSAVGSWQALTTAFDECDRVGRSRCRLAGHAAYSWHQVIHRLRQGPLRLGPDFRLRYSDLVSLTLGELYELATYRPLMRAIAFVHDQIVATTGARAVVDARSAYEWLKTKVRQSRIHGPYVFGKRRFDMSFNGIACADSINPSRPRAWIGATRRADQRSPWFGAAWAWESSACARWPGSSADAFGGPFRTRTSEPVLIVGNTHDPATPISGARHLNMLFTGSRMLTLDGWGHGALGTSRCITKRTQGYLVHGTLPLPGRVCKENKQLFPRRSAG